MTPEERIRKAKVGMLISQPWFGQLSCYLNPVEVKDPKVLATAAINERGDLFYNPDFVTMCSDIELKGLLCHEILHLAFQHPFRLQTRDHELFNLAADLKVNDELNHCLGSGIALPKGAMLPEYGNWECANAKVQNIGKKTTEQIYQELKKQSFKIPSFILDLSNMGQSGKPGKKGKGKEGINTVRPSELPALAKEWAARVETANAQRKGDIPAGLLRELRDLEYPELPWVQIIRQRLRVVSTKRSWKSPNKKYLPWYFPGVTKIKGLTAVVAIDTSGSMSTEQLTKALSEIWGLAEAFKGIKFFLLTCDAAVWDSLELTNGNKALLKRIKMRGGGGTDFRPVFDVVKKKYERVMDCLIFFTDGYGSFPEKKPSYPVYWVTDSRNVKFPFGKVLYLKEQKR